MMDRSRRADAIFKRTDEEKMIIFKWRTDPATNYS